MNKLITTFLNLVKIDSPTGSEDKIINYLNDLLISFGFKPFKDKFGNLIININGFGQPLFLSAHVDTVEPGKNINPIIRNGIIRSDGKTILGADNKAALAAIVELLRKISEDKIQTKRLNIVFTKSEESGNFGAVNLNYKKINSKEGYIFDNATPIGTIITASPFYNRIDIKIIGKASHASRPRDGINVINVFNNAMKKNKLGSINSKTIINIGFLQAGDARNTIPGEMIMKGEIRSFFEDDIDKYSKSIINAFKDSAKKFGAKIETSLVRENPGYEYKSSDSLIEKTKKIMNANGIVPVLKKNYGCSDANIFVGNSIKVINLGNGAVGAHTREEYISSYDLQKLYKLILSLATSK